MSTAKPVIKDVLSLMTIPQFGPGRIRRLLSIFESAEEILKTPLKRLMQVDGIDEKLARQIKSGVDEKQVEEQLQLMEKENIGCLSIWDEKFPPLLKKTVVPPVLLFYKGRLPESWPGCIGVVGTRMPSQYGRTVTERIVSQLTDNSIAVISGLDQPQEALQVPMVRGRPQEPRRLLSGPVVTALDQGAPNLLFEHKGGAVLEQVELGTVGGWGVRRAAGAHQTVIAADAQGRIEATPAAMLQRRCGEFLTRDIACRLLQQP